MVGFESCCCQMSSNLVGPDPPRVAFLFQREPLLATARNDRLQLLESYMLQPALAGGLQIMHLHVAVGPVVDASFDEAMPQDLRHGFTLLREQTGG